MDIENIRVEKLKQKIRRFNGLMGEISQEFTTLFFEGNEDMFHDVVLEMIKSLDKAQKTVRMAYSLVSGKDKTEFMKNENETDKIEDIKTRIQEFTIFMEAFTEELNTKFFEGKHIEFQEAVEDMIESLDKTRESTKKAYFQSFGNAKSEKGHRGSGGGP